MNKSALLVILLCAAGCAVTRQPQPQERTQATGMELPVISRAETPTNLLRTTFTFDANPDASVTGHKVYYGESIGAITNTVLLGTNRVVTIEHDSYPLHAMATAYNAAGIESVPSNQAGVLGKQVVVTGYDQRSDSPAGPFTDAGQVFTRTNPPTTFHRLRIESRNELVTYP